MSNRIKHTHNTPGITLDQFITMKPKELRLGQWFINCYWKGSDQQSQELYQLDGAKAKRMIEGFMCWWHWNTLPEFK